MIRRPNLAKVMTLVILTLMMLSLVSSMVPALEISDEYNITDSSDMDRQHRIAVDSDGNYHLAYNVVGGGDDFIVYRKIGPTGTTLAGPTNISPSEVQGSYDYIAISVDTSERVHIAYSCYGQNDDASNVYYTQLDKTGAVKVNFKNVAPSASASRALDIDTDGMGNAYIVFEERSDPPTIQWMKVSVSGSVSVHPKEISGGLGLNGDVGFPRLGVSSSGKNYIAWQQQNNQFSQVALYYTQLTSSGTVDIDPVEVVSHAVYDLVYLEAAEDSAGNLNLLFTQSNSVHWAVIDVNGNTDRNVEIASSLLGQTAAMDIEVAPNGNVAMVYIERENIINAPWLPNIRIWDSIDESLGAAEQLYGGPNSVTTPRVASMNDVTGVVYIRGNDLYLVTVAETAANRPPVAVLSFYPTDPSVDETVTFDGRDSTDPDDGDYVDEYNFEYGDGSSSGWVTTATATHVYSASGTYTARLRVRDSQGLESTSADTASVTVTPATTNKPPTAVLNANPTSAEKDQEVTFDGTSSFDTDGVVSQYLFTYGDGKNSGWVSTGTVKHAYTKEGIYTATLKVQDEDGADSAVASTQVTVLDTNEKPTASITSIEPNPAMVGDDITFTGSGSDTDGTIAAYSWESDMDGPLGNAATITAKLQEGTHSIIFKVQDDDGDWSDAATQSVVVKANSPFTITDETQLPKQIYTDTLVEFRVTYKDPDNDRPNLANLVYSKGADFKTVELIEVDDGDTNYVDGKDYYFNKKFDEGNWKYYFEFRNSKNPKKSAPSPPVEFESKAAPGFFPAWEAGPAVGAMAVVAVALVVMTRRRKLG